MKMMMKKVLGVLCALLIALTAFFAVHPALADGGWGSMYMYVETGNSGKLHLRAGPGSSYASLGLYRSGTPVLVEGFANGSWASVLVDGRRGYMNVHYLSGCAPAQAGPVSFPAGTDYTILYVRTGNGGRLHLRADASRDAVSLGLYANGTQVYALSLDNGWSQVTVDGITGFMLTGCLSPVPPSMYSWSAAQPTAAPYVYRYTPTASPTPRVTYRYWYIQPTAAPQSAVYYPQLPPAPTASPASSLYAGAVITVRNRNSTFVYLRSSRDSDRKDNILAQVPVGAQVMMLEPGEYWCRVRYGGLEGYMVSRYLK